MSAEPLVADSKAANNFWGCRQQTQPVSRSLAGLNGCSERIKSRMISMFGSRSRVIVQFTGNSPQVIQDRDHRAPVWADGLRRLSTSILHRNRRLLNATGRRQGSLGSGIDPKSGFQQDPPFHSLRRLKIAGKCSISRLFKHCPTAELGRLRLFG